MSLAWRNGPTTDSFGGVMWTVVAASELAAMLPVTATPSSCSRKSRWNQARRNSPSVTLRKPIASTLATAAAIASSSTARSSPGEIDPGGPLRPRLVDGRRSQQAADLLGAERRVESAHGRCLAVGSPDGSSVMTKMVGDGARGSVAAGGHDGAPSVARQPQQAPIALTIGYGLTAEPPPGWTSRCRCGPPALPVCPT